MPIRALATAAACGFLAACAIQMPQPVPEGPPPPVLVPPPPSAAQADVALPRYRCDQGISFTVQFGDGTAVVDAGNRGHELLLRDAGGLTPQQTVFSNTKMKAEFGLDPAGRGAKLRFLESPLEATCLKE